MIRRDGVVYTQTYSVSSVFEQEVPGSVCVLI